MNKLEARVNTLNDELRAAAAVAWPALSKKFEGPALIYAQGRLVLTETQTPTAPDDAVGLHVFHAVLSSRFTAPAAPKKGGRDREQYQFVQLGMIIYSTEPDAYDVLSDTAARVRHISMLRAELTPQGVRKLLGLAKDANATNAGDGRYLFAVIYEAEILVGGLVC